MLIDTETASPTSRFRQNLLEKSRYYDWKDRNIARRFAEDIYDMVSDYGSEITISAIRNLREEWERDSGGCDGMNFRYGAGLEFLFLEIPAAKLFSRMMGE